MKVFQHDYHFIITIIIIIITMIVIIIIIRSFIHSQDPGSGEAFKDDAVCQQFLKKGVEKLNSTNKPSDVNAR